MLQKSKGKMMCSGGCPALPVDERAGLSGELGIPLGGIQLSYGEIKRNTIPNFH